MKALVKGKRPRILLIGESHHDAIHRKEAKLIQKLTNHFPKIFLLIEGYPFAIPYGELSRQAMDFSKLVYEAYNKAIEGVVLPRDAHRSMKSFFNLYTSMFATNISYMREGYLLDLSSGPYSILSDNSAVYPFGLDIPWPIPVTPANPSYILNEMDNHALPEEDLYIKLFHSYLDVNRRAIQFVDASLRDWESSHFKALMLRSAYNLDAMIDILKVELDKESLSNLAKLSEGEVYALTSSSAGVFVSEDLPAYISRFIGTYRSVYFALAINETSQFLNDNDLLIAIMGSAHVPLVKWLTNPDFVLFQECKYSLSLIVADGKDLIAFPKLRNMKDADAFRASIEQYNHFINVIKSLGYDGAFIDDC